jgi:hypothetical protein
MFLKKKHFGTENMGAENTLDSYRTFATRVPPADHPMSQWLTSQGGICVQSQSVTTDHFSRHSTTQYKTYEPKLHTAKVLNLIYTLLKIQDFMLNLM